MTMTAKALAMRMVSFIMRSVFEVCGLLGSKGFYQ
jgi:hypothetical protein